MWDGDFRPLPNDPLTDLPVVPAGAYRPVLAENRPLACFPGAANPAKPPNSILHEGVPPRGSPPRVLFITPPPRPMGGCAIRRINRRTQGFREEKNR